MSFQMPGKYHNANDILLPIPERERRFMRASQSLGNLISAFGGSGRREGLKFDYKTFSDFFRMFMDTDGLSDEEAARSLDVLATCYVHTVLQKETSLEGVAAAMNIDHHTLVQIADEAQRRTIGGFEARFGKLNLGSMDQPDNSGEDFW